MPRTVPESLAYDQKLHDMDLASTVGSCALE